MLIYKQLEYIFDTFNSELFEAILGAPVQDCVITLQRKSNTQGYMTYDAFSQAVQGNSRVHEIALNPEFFGIKPRISILQNMVHQMTHVYQHQNGEVLKPGAHDEQFMDFMMAIGLMPSSNGLPDGKNVGGKKMFNYPLPDGEFLGVCNRLAREGKLFDWFELTSSPKVTPNAMVRELYDLKELIGDLVEPSLLEIPLLISRGIDSISLINTLNIDHETNKVCIDEDRAKDLIESSFERDQKDEPKQFQPTHPEYDRPTNRKKAEDLPDVEGVSTRGAKVYNTPTPNVESPFAALSALEFDGVELERDQLEDQIREEIFADGAVSEDDHEVLSEQYHEVSNYGRNDDIDGDDEAARFLKQAIANKPETKSLKVESPNENKAPRIAKNINEVAALLGFESADGNKAPEKKKTKFKYTCSCGQILHGGLGLSVICGKCQLHFMCETIEKETGVVEN